MATTRPTRNWPRSALILLLLCGFGLRLFELTRQDIWWDEARNIDVALRPFLQVATAPELDIHPPIYFWSLHAWAGFFSLEIGVHVRQMAYVARLLSAFAGLLGVALLYPLTRRIGRISGQTAGLCAVTLAAIAPFWLAESQEARMYTVGFALLMAAAVAFLRMVEEERGATPSTGSGTGSVAGAWGEERGARNERPGEVDAPSRFYRYRFHGAFVLLSALALLTHYNVVFILVAWYLWWGVWALMQPLRWRRLGTVFVCGLAMTLLVLPVMPIALRQIPTYANPNLVVPGVGDYLWQNWRAYLGGYAFEPSMLWQAATFWLWLGLILLIVGVTLAWIGGSTRQLSFLVVWLVGGLALYYIAVVDRGAFNVRYASFVTPALYALLGITLAGFGRLWRPLPVIGLALLLVGMTPAVYADIYDADHAREDMAGLTEWLQENTGPNDVIFVDQKYPFGFYYPGYVIDAEAPAVANGKAPARYLFVDINTIDERLTDWASQAERVFWVQWFESDTDPRHSVSFLLDMEGQRAGEQWFRGYSVDWWQMRPPTEFELAQTFTPVDIRWPPAVSAVEIALPDEPLVAGETVFVVVRWQRAGSEPFDRPLKARVALYNTSDSRVAQSDERILNDRHLMPGEWGQEDSPLNVYRLETPDELEPGTYEVRLLVYDAETLEPLGYVDEAGNPVGVEVAVGEIDIIINGE